MRLNNSKDLFKLVDGGDASDNFKTKVNIARGYNIVASGDDSNKV